jgi:hypothetical protein
VIRKGETRLPGQILPALLAQALPFGQEKEPAIAGLRGEASLT